MAIEASYCLIYFIIIPIEVLNCIYRIKTLSNYSLGESWKKLEEVGESWTVKLKKKGGGGMDLFNETNSTECITPHKP